MAEYLPEKVRYNDEDFVPYLTQAEINSRIVELASELMRDFKDKDPIFIGVLNGAFVFLADLMKHINMPCEIDFLKLSSYGDEKVSSGTVTDLKEIDANITGRHIILVEDIVDTGLSMKYLVDKLKPNNPASISVVTLLHKKVATQYDVPLNYVGFEIPDEFVVGYGLDYAQKGRNLAQIYRLENLS